MFAFIYLSFCCTGSLGSDYWTSLVVAFSRGDFSNETFVLCCLVKIRGTSDSVIFQSEKTFWPFALASGLVRPKHTSLRSRVEAVA